MYPLVAARVQRPAVFIKKRPKVICAEITVRTSSHFSAPLYFTQIPARKTTGWTHFSTQCVKDNIPNKPVSISSSAPLKHVCSHVCHTHSNNEWQCVWLYCCGPMTRICHMLLLLINADDTSFTHWWSMGIMPCFLTVTGNQWGRRHHLHLQIITTGDQ